MQSRPPWQRAPKNERQNLGQNTQTLPHPRTSEAFMDGVIPLRRVSTCTLRYCNLRTQLATERKLRYMVRGSNTTTQNVPHPPSLMPSPHIPLTQKNNNHIPDPATDAIGPVNALTHRLKPHHSLSLSASPSATGESPIPPPCQGPKTWVSHSTASCRGILFAALLCCTVRVAGLPLAWAADPILHAPVPSDVLLLGATA
jgi:hypothetical protein